MMSYNLCSLSKDDQEKVEVEKAAAYAVWKERNPEIKIPAESEAGNYKGEMQTYFLQQVERYRKVR
ncbi:DNA polymerase III subunit theta [Aeromonas hydrophila]|uniref:DNA polymerase III subunit theta n=2 Tax=Aeromonas hydrophila TaxID=644 RepID=UPI00214B5B3F|nr:DNA polymerase III subunit theta [Aeromonas hydrophila]